MNRTGSGADEEKGGKCQNYIRNKLGHSRSSCDNERIWDLVACRSALLVDYFDAATHHGADELL